MSYAVKNDGTGWRSVNSASDIMAGETFSATQPVLVIPPQPNVPGFVTATKAAMGGIVGANALMRAYPAFMDTINNGVWADAQALILDAKSTNALTAAQYADFQTAATANHIPISLP